MSANPVSTFAAGTSLAAIARALHWADAQQVEQALSQAGLQADVAHNAKGVAVLRQPLRYEPDAARFVAVPPVRPGTAGALTPPSPARPNASSHSQRNTAVPGLWAQFVSTQTTRMLENEIRDTLHLSNRVSLGVDNKVTRNGADPEQRRFLDTHPQGRILRSTITLDAGRGTSLPITGSFEGTVADKYHVTLELPYDDFSTGGAHERLDARMHQLYDVASLSSDAFARRLATTDEPAGTRIVRDIELDGGVALSPSDTSARADRKTQLTVTIRWLGGHRVQVQVSTLRHDAAALSQTLAPVTAHGGVERSNGEKFTYVLDTTVAAHRDALAKALTWGNTLVPSKIDLQALEALHVGWREIDMVHAHTGGLDVFLPVSVGPTARFKTSHGTSERLTASAPDHDQHGKPITRAMVSPYLTAFAHNDIDTLSTGIAGLHLQRISTNGSSHSATGGWQRGVALGKYLGVGAATSLTGTKGDSQVVGLRVEYHAKDAHLADVVLWRLDTNVLTHKFAEKVGVQLDAAARDTIERALRDHLLHGIGLSRYADTLSRPVFHALRDFVELIDMKLEHAQQSTIAGYEAVRLSNFNLRNSTDRAEFAAVLQHGDPSLALANGKLAYSVMRARDTQNHRNSFEWLGLRLLHDNTDWARRENQQIRVGNEIFDLQIDSAGASAKDRGFTEDNDYSATELMLSQNGRVEHAITKVELRSNDAMFWSGESQQLEDAVRACRLKIHERQVGKGDWLLSWIPGTPRLYGPAKTDIAGVILPAGHRHILATAPADAQRNAMRVASRFAGVSLPPSETLAANNLDVPLSLQAVALLEKGRIDSEPHLGASFATAYPNADPAVVQTLLELGWHTTYDRSLDDVRARARRLPALANLPDAELDDLLGRAAMADALYDVYRLRHAHRSGPRNTNSQYARLQQALRRYATATQRFAGRRRDGRVDVRIVLAGFRMRDLFERPPMRAAREALGLATRAPERPLGSLTTAQAQKLVDDTFRDIAKTSNPDDSTANLVFWLALLDAAGDGNWMAVVEASAKEYHLVASSPGIDAGDVKRRMAAETAATAARNARIAAGGPAKLHLQ